MEEQKKTTVSSAEPAVQPQPTVAGAPDVSPVPHTPSVGASFATPQKPAKKPLIIGIVVALLVLIGAGVASAYIYMNNKPEKVLADAFTNTASDLLDKKPASSVGELTFESKGDTPAKVNITFDGKSSGENGQGSADVTVTFAGKTYNVKTSAVAFGESEFYFKIENLKKTLSTLTASQPEFAMYTDVFDPIVSKLDNQWIKVTKDDLKQLGMADEKKVDKCTAAVQSLKLSKDDKKQLKKLFKENQFVVASEKLKSEKASDETSFHYKLDFNDKAAENFAKQVIEMKSFATVKKDCDIDQKDIEDGFKNENKAEEKDDVKPVVELWVGKKSRRPTKFKITANDKEFSMDFNTEVKLNAKDVTVEKPSSSISVNELKKEFEKLMPSSATSTTDFQNL